MKIKELWTSYSEYTLGVTEYSRRLAFVIAAICWFFKTDAILFPQLIFKSLIAIVLFFIFDLLQYVFSAIFLFVWTRVQEHKIWKDTGKLSGIEEVDKPAWLDWPAQFFFLSKLTSLFFSSYYLLSEFYKRIL